MEVEGWVRWERGRGYASLAVSLAVPLAYPLLYDQGLYLHIYCELPVYLVDLGSVNYHTVCLPCLQAVIT